MNCFNCGKEIKNIPVFPYKYYRSYDENGLPVRFEPEKPKGMAIRMPFNEDLLNYDEPQCPDCSGIYHKNWYLEKKLGGIL